VVIGLIFSLGNKVSTQAEFIETYKFFTELRVLFALYVGAILLGILVGVVSSMFAMEKHLKLKHW